MKFSQEKFEKFFKLKKGDIALLENFSSQMPSKETIEEMIYIVDMAFNLAKRVSEIRSGEYVEDESTPSLRAERSSP